MRRIVLLVTAGAILTVMMAIAAGPTFGAERRINDNACAKGQADNSPKIMAIAKAGGPVLRDHRSLN